MADLFKLLGCDTCAYCAGMLLGKHKMAPKLSPKKSVEGGIGGIVGAALLGAIFAVAANKITGAGVNPAQYAVICGVGGMISQIGDLAASAIKRNHDIKDYGKLIPDMAESLTDLTVLSLQHRSFIILQHSLQEDCRR